MKRPALMTNGPDGRARAHRAVRVVALALLLVGGWSLTTGGRTDAASAAVAIGTATITSPVTSKPLAAGGSADLFTVVLPTGAACAGDTATDGYHVYSYLIHKGADLTATTFVNFPSQGYGLVDNTGTYFGAANTAITTGQIIAIPNDFEWAPLVSSGGGSVALADLLYGGSTGVWETGLACADTTGAFSSAWNTEVTFTASTTDAGGFTWTAVPGPSGTTTTTTTTTAPPGATTTTVGTTTTTQPGGTTTTTEPTSTTVSAATTTSTAPSDSTSTTLAGDATTSTTVDPFAGSLGGGTDPSSGTGATLARTGSPLVHFTAIGLLCIGLGLVLLGFDARMRAERREFFGLAP